MSELRRNPLTGHWVIIASERVARPHDAVRAARRAASPSHDERCPFCPGNEPMTPPPLLEMAAPDPPGAWRVRAFANKYAALSPDAAPSNSRSPLLQSRPGIGAHEVIVETPVHNRFLADRTEDEMTSVVQAYQQRCEARMQESTTAYLLIFKNHGEEAGTSLIHPHSQAIAAPIVPEDVRRACDIAQAHFSDTRRCLLCNVAEEELKAGERIVSRDERFVVFHPFAAARPAETWIVPLEHQSTFHDLPADDLEPFASVLLRTLRQLRAAFDDPDYNYAIHSAPVALASEPYLHWYVQLIPRLTKAAGFELGSGIYINPLAPEESADAMRSASAQDAQPSSGQGAAHSGPIGPRNS